MKKSSVINISFLATVAAALSACGPPPVHVHLNESGECISNLTGQPVNQQICYGHGGGGYVYVSSESAPYYSNPASPGYVQPSSTVRGIFGGSADAAEGGGHGGSGGEGAGE